MGYIVSNRAKQLASKTAIEPNIVFVINGYPIKFGAVITQVNAYIGQPGLKIGNFIIGGQFDDADSRDWLSLEGTSTSISQQLDPDKAVASSTQSMKVRVVDIDGQISRLISPGKELADVLYRDANIYLGFKGGSFPADYIDLFNGKIQGVSALAGAIEFTVVHPEDIKRSEIFTKSESKLLQAAQFNSVEIQDLTYFQRGDFPGTAQIRYLSTPFTGDVATVIVSGNLIDVQIDTAATRASTIKRAIENNQFANQIVTVKVSGNASDIQAAVGTTNLSSSTELFLEDVTGFFTPEPPLFRTYVRIEDEVMEYTGVDVALNKLTGVTRAQLDTFGNFHDVDEAVSSFYVLGDGTDNSNAIDLALKIMLSGPAVNYAEGLQATDFVNYGTVPNYTNGVYFRGIDLPRSINLQIGDFITITGATEVANNITDEVIEDFEVIDGGTLVYVSGYTFTLENDSVAVASFSSQYNTLPDGAGMSPSQVDIAKFLEIKSRYGSAIGYYQFYLKDTVNVRELIDQQIYLPSALYPVPRKGKTSIGYTAPPLYAADSKTLTINNILGPSKLKVDRGVTKNFYNSIVYRYNEDSIEEKALNGRVILSNDSTNRIAAPNKPYTIFAKGLRPSAQTTSLIERNADRFLARYRYAAETIEVRPVFSDGYTIEVGDTCVFGEPDLKVTDTTTGTRDFRPRIFEVINKDFNWKTGEVRLRLVDTNYTTGVRYGVISPASKVASGSTTSVIKIADSFGVATRERDKWEPYIGRPIRVRSADYATSNMVTFIGFLPTDSYSMIVNPVLPSAPPAGYIVDVPDYDDLGVQEQLYKAIHTFFTPTVDVVAGVSVTVVTVDSGDIGKFFVGGRIRVTSEDYTVDSGDREITQISGNNITVRESFGFIPAAGQKINLIGFVSDEGPAYVFS